MVGIGIRMTLRCSLLVVSRLRISMSDDFDYATARPVHMLIHLLPTWSTPILFAITIGSIAVPTRNRWYSKVCPYPVCKSGMDAAT